MPQAIASIIVRPKRSGRVVMCTSASAFAEQFVARLALDRAEKLHPIAVDVRRDLLAEILLVVWDRRHLQAHAGALGDLDREMRPFLGMEAAEKDEIVARPVDEGELAPDRCRCTPCPRYARPGIAIGVADRAEEAALRAGVVRGENLRRREAVNRREQRRRVGRERVRHRLPVEVVVDQIELARARAKSAPMCSAREDVTVERGIFVEADGDDRGELSRERELPVANSVTSSPRACMPSAML